jgi:uncharacterized coiled-coil DUF342 family protein
MERGFSNLNDSLASLELALEEVGVPKMIEDLNSINNMVADMIVDVEEYSAKMEEFNLKVLEMQERLNSMLLQVQQITEVVNGMKETAAGLATSAQMQELLSQVEEFQSGVDQLVAIADYDVDGVMNALDECPDTVLGATVDANGCSQEQLNN